MRRILTFAVVVAAPLIARADELPSPVLKVEITSLSPAVPGIEATIVPSPLAHLPPQIELSNSTPSELLLLGTAGEPFLRVGPLGVFGNMRSRTFVLSYNPTGATAVATGGPAPLWKKFSQMPRWRWYESRAHYRGKIPTPIARSRTIATIMDWSVPGRYQSAPFAINGRVAYKPILGQIKATIVRVDPSHPGVRFRLVDGPIPGIELRNDSPDVVEITGRDGAPFLRVGPSGVQANVNSPTYRDTRPTGAAGGTGVSWKQIQALPLFVWLEKRAAYTQPDAPDAVQAAGKLATLTTWSVGGTVGGSAFRIEGITQWVPLKEASKGSGSAFPLAASIAGVVAAGGVAYALRRARRP